MSVDGVIYDASNILIVNGIITIDASNILIVNGIITIDGVTQELQQPNIVKIHQDAGVNGNVETKGSITLYGIVNGSITIHGSYMKVVTDDVISIVAEHGSHMKVVTDDVISIVAEANGHETSRKVPINGDFVYFDGVTVYRWSHG
jgi:hypothetical protein